MALNGISTATSTTPTLTKVLRRDLKLAEAQAKRQSLTTSTWYRPLNILNGTYSAYVNGSTGAELVTLSGTASPTPGHPWSTGTVSTYTMTIRSFNTGTSTPGGVITTCNEGDTIWIEATGTNLTVLGGPDSYLQLGGVNITAGDIMWMGSPILDPLPWPYDLNAPYGGAPLLVVADTLTEGNETLTWTWYVNSATVASSSCTIVDTSLTPVTLLLSLDAGNPVSYAGTGTVWTDTVGSIPFTLYGSPSYSASNGGYLTFVPGSSQYADSTTSLPALGNWTVEVWHYYDGTEFGNACIVSEKFTAGFINYALGTLDQSGLQAGFYNGWNTTPGYTLTANNWYHIVGSYDGSTVKLYINGTLVEQAAHTQTSIHSGGGINLMRRWDNPDYWGGRLSVVRIYDGAISQTLVTSNFNTEKSRYGL